MTTLFTDDGRAYAATVVSATPAVALQVKTPESDGYRAVVIASGERKESHINKAEKGRMKELGNFRTMKEFRPKRTRETIEGIEVGAKFDVSVFSEGDKVAVSAISKGKGFQGVVKRHGFAGGPRTHGQKHSEREPGSIGGGGRAGGRVVKGMRMAGRMGGDRITVKNLKVLQVDKDSNTLVLSGAIPGRRGALVEVRGM